MSELTKKAIKEACVELLNEKPLAQIKVKEIVERCGINRNSFYYHYADLPTLIESIVMEDADDFIKNHPCIASLEDGFDDEIAFVLKNKKAIYHIYHSINRDLFEKYLMKLSRYIVASYFEKEYGHRCISEDDKELLIRYMKNVLFGVVIDYLEMGMKDDLISSTRRLAEIKKGMLEEMVNRCENSH